MSPVERRSARIATGQMLSPATIHNRLLAMAGLAQRLQVVHVPDLAALTDRLDMVYLGSRSDPSLCLAVGAQRVAR